MFCRRLSMVYHELKEIADKQNTPLKEAMRALRGIKLSKEKNAWKTKNAVKSKRQIAESLGVDLMPEITSPA